MAQQCNSEYVLLFNRLHVSIHGSLLLPVPRLTKDFDSLLSLYLLISSFISNMPSCRCEPKLEGFAVFAEHPAVIITAYLVVIFPWGLVENVDFTTEKWRTVQHTRHLGYLHLTLSIVPVPYIMFYVHLQQISSDYKEMMAAVFVIHMAMYHISRTIWGLLQLDAYHMWCKDLMERMLILKMVRAEEWDKKLWRAEEETWEKIKHSVSNIFKIKSEYLYGMGLDLFQRRNRLVDESDQVTKKMDRMLKVNNEMVDNELGGTDLAVSIDWKKVGRRRPSEWLRTGEAELFTARWCTAFLCEFGHYWGSPTY